MNEELRGIIQKMIDNDESQETMNMVIAEYERRNKTDGESGKDTTTGQDESVVVEEPSNVDLTSDDGSLELSKVEEEKPEEDVEAFGIVDNVVDFFSDLSTAWNQGSLQGEMTDLGIELAGFGVGDDPANDQDVINFIEGKKKELRLSSQSFEMKEFDRIYEEAGGGWWGFLKGAAYNPSTLSSMLVSSISSQLSSIRNSEEVAAAALAGGTAGAAVGLAGFGVGAIPGAIAGAMSASMGMMEAGLTFNELLMEEIGGNINDPGAKDKIKAILDNPEKLQDLKTRARNRGAAIAGIELATMGLAKGLGGKLASKGIGKATRIAAIGGTEIIGGGTGEVVGRLAAGQEMDIKEIGFEAFAGLGSAPLTMSGQVFKFQKAVQSAEIGKKIRESNEYGDIVDAYKSDKDGNFKTNAVDVEISKLSKSSQILDSRVEEQILTGKLTKAEGDVIKQNFRRVQGSVSRIKSLDLTTEQEAQAVDKLAERDKIQNELNELKETKSEAITAGKKEELKVIDNEISEIIKADSKAKVEESSTFAKKAGKAFGIEVIDDLTTADIVKQFDTDETKFSEADGFFKDGKIYINKEVAAETRAVSVGSHELLHGILQNSLMTNKESSKIIQDFRSQLNKKQNAAIDLRANATDKDGNRLYSQEELDNSPDEYLAFFSDAIAKNEIKFDEGLGTMLMDFITPILRKVGFAKIKFNTGKDVYNFMREYDKSIKSGKLSKSIQEDLVPGVTTVDSGDAKLSRSEDASDKLSKITIGEQLEAVLPEGMTNEEYKENGWKSVLAEVMTTDVLDGVIRNELKRRDIDTSGLDANVFGQPIEDFVEDVKGSAELQNTIKRWDGRGTIGGFIVTELQKFRIGDVSNKLKNKPQTQSIEGNIKAQNVIVEEDSSGGIIDDKLPKMPSETTKYQNALVDNLGIKESEINAALDKVIKEAYTDKKIVTFGDTRVLPKSVADFYGKMFGINPQTLTDKTRNFQKYDAEGLTRAKQYLIANAPGDYSRLPKTKTDSNKGTFIPRKVTESLYTDGKLTGSLKDYMNLIKEKPVKPIYRDKVSQTIRGLLGVNIRNRVFETVVPSQGQRLIGGAKFSLSTKQDLANYKNIASLKVNNDATGQPLFRPSNIKLVRKEIMKFFGFDYVNKKDTGKAYSTRNRNAKLPENIANKQGETFIEGSTRVVGDFLNQNPKWRNALRASTTAGVERGLFTTTKVFEKLFPIKKGVKQEGIRYGYTGKGKVLSEKFANSTKEKDFVENQYKQIDNLIDFFSDVETYLKKNPKDAWVFDAIVKDAQDNQNSIFRSSAPILFLATDSKGKLLFNVPLRQEHSMPQNNVSTMLLDMAINGRVKQDSKVIKATYMQGGLTMADDGLLDVDYKFTMPEVYWNEVFPRILSGDLKLPNGLAAVIRMTESGVNLDNLKYLVTGKSISEFFFDTKGVPVEMQKELISDYFTGKKDLKLIKDIAAKRVLINPSQIKASKSNNDKSAFKYSKTPTNKTTIETAATTDKALNVARDLDAPVKKIRVFDFDDTLAQTKSDVLYTMPDGTEGKLNAEQFANDGSTLLSEGAVFDFSEFNKVTEGKKGPLFKVAQTIAAKRGTEDVFVLTARAPESQLAIYEFLKSQGLDIPLKNITGLGDSTGDAKARWIVDKAADGYNDFYFADDAPQNVKAVRSALSVLDVKSKTQQAKVQFSKSVNLNKDFNDIIANKTGIASDKTYARVKAEVVGASKGKWKFFIPPSAEDFVGLLYATLGKGTIGDAQMAWYKAHLLNPFASAMNDLANDRAALMQDFKALKKNLKIVPKNLRKKIPGEPFTQEQAVRAYIWDQQGMDIPGMSQQDQKDLVDFVEKDSNLKSFAAELIAINKGDAYAAPDAGWIAGTIDTDLMKGLNTTKRTKYLSVWQQNVNEIFSEENLNKLEAAYGKEYRVAMENILQRMKTGRNRSFGSDTITGRFTDWLTNSVGAIMFFNTRSAVLQTISAINFVNFSDNNVLKAGQAFANQPQYWKDFVKLFNSPFLLDRRSGIKINVNEADIAEMAKGPGNSARNVIAGLLKLGFLPTQIADSFAIASGGATFYRNRIKALMKEGLSQAEAEESAFRDFREIAEESQQSSRPDKISQQQAGPLGRIVLAFANTPAQYARLIKKAASDLKNGRGDAKTNISKIIYYGVAQNLLFATLQQALFAIGFGDEEDEEKKRNEKYFDIANSMSDSILRGTGVYGAVASVVKNTAIRLAKEADKKAPKYQDAVVKGVLQISPPVSSKIGKLQSAGRSFSWNQEEMRKKGWAIDNPAYLASANVISAVTNIPLDRAVKKVTNVVDAGDGEVEFYKRIALVLGWSAWELGIEKEKEKSKSPTSRSTRRTRSKRTRSRSRTKKRN